MNIIEAIRDPNLFRPFLANKKDSLSTWKPWLIALRVLHGLPVTSSYGRDLIRQCTGRDPKKLPADGYGFNQALFLTGRRSGKSRIAALTAAYAAALSGLEKKLAPGEVGMVPVVAPTKHQGRIVRNYLRAIFQPSMLNQEVVSDRKNDTFVLRNGVTIDILPGDFRHVRGYTILQLCCDELAHFSYAEDSRVRSDTELVRAIQPSLATVNGRFIGISTPYGRKGFCWNTYNKHFGNNKSKVLVWNAPSRVMNCTLPQSVVDAALAEDMASAKAEYLGEFRDDVCIFLPPELIDNLVVKGRLENLPRPKISYSAFYDGSGGRNDAAAVSIAHLDGRKVVHDLIRNFPSPHNPYQVIADMAGILKQWGIRRVMGDAYAGEFSSAAWASHGIGYKKCSKQTSELYQEMLPLISSGELELLDNKLLIKQLCALERRTRGGGRDQISHPPRSHDDSAASLAGVCFEVKAKKLVFGAAGF